ncbi:hypothetical protein [Aeromonas sanarellii]|uniref:hypothetical protein n=1 Tax=Aeromonas sanarellii TaxID=633415 RepID=UPI0038CF631A
MHYYLENENLYFDLETGEVYEHPHTNENLEAVEYKHPVEEFSSIHSRKLSECKTVEELMEACENDEYQSSTVEFEGGALFNIITSKIIPFDGAQQFRAMQLAGLITIRNAAMTTTGAIADTLGIDKKNLKRELQSLIDTGLIEVFSPCGDKNKVRVILFNPFLFWKGDYSVRNMIRNLSLETGEWQLDKKAKTALTITETTAPSISEEEATKKPLESPDAFADLVTTVTDGLIETLEDIAEVIEESYIEIYRNPHVTVAANEEDFTKPKYRKIA